MNDYPTRFVMFPKEWGIYIPYGGKPRKLMSHDIKKLEWFREQLAHKYFQLVSYKEDMKPLDGSWPTTFILARLHANSLIFKFAKQMHTQSGRPEYIRWWIWEDYEQFQGVTIGYDSAAPVYISAR